MAKLTLPQAEAKVYEITKQLIKLRVDCKDTVAGYKEKIKDLELEIKAIVDEQNAP
jgi:hypothetical protein